MEFDRHRRYSKLRQEEAFHFILDALDIEHVIVEKGRCKKGRSEFARFVRHTQLLAGSVMRPSTSHANLVAGKSYPVPARDTDIYIGTTLTLQPLSQSRSWYGRVSLLGIARSEGERSNAVDLPTNEPRSIPETGNCDGTKLSPEGEEEEEEEGKEVEEEEEV